MRPCAGERWACSAREPVECGRLECRGPCRPVGMRQVERIRPWLLPAPIRHGLCISQCWARPKAVYRANEKRGRLICDTRVKLRIWLVIESTALTTATGISPAPRKVTGVIPETEALKNPALGTAKPPRWPALSKIGQKI